MERKYIIPLRKEFRKVPLYKRTSKAVKGVRNFIAKHMKSDDVKIGPHLNRKLWERGSRNPPHKVEVVAEKVEEEKDKKKVSYVRVELFGAPKEEKKTKKEKRSLLSRLKGEEKKVEKTPVEVKKEEAKAEKKEEAKVEEKALEKESKELQKEKLPKPDVKEEKPVKAKAAQKARSSRTVKGSGSKAKKQ